MESKPISAERASPMVKCRRRWRHRHHEALRRFCRPMIAWSGLCLLFATGCATTGSYQYGRVRPDSLHDSESTEVVVEYGTPVKTLDRIGDLLGTPEKLLSLNSKMDNHQVSAETVEKLVTYLEKNDLHDVHVSVNQYSPREQWRRLQENRRLSPGWKYTAGSLSVVRYSLFPGRLFGGTEYNPYTDTLSVNSDVPAVLLVEAAYAKDIHSRKFPGCYAVFANGLPLVKTWRQSRAVRDVLEYAKAEQDWEIEAETYRVAFPRLGASAAGEAAVLIMPTAGPISSFFLAPVLSATGAAAGHLTGRSIAKTREHERQQILEANPFQSHGEEGKPPSMPPPNTSQQPEDSVFEEMPLMIQDTSPDQKS